MRNHLLLVGLATLLSMPAFAQEDLDLFDLSLEELMNVEIVSASKKEESLFDAPVSSYSITREEIEKSGVISIPEALRLCPGVIVREMTNGNYDIHLRGLDNVVQYGTRGSQINTRTLLMIDNRPVFNYTYGGVFWEALPIDLIDVERIEVVRGPSSPLFGPNAMTGVVNIITRRVKQEGWNVRADLQYGSPQTAIGNLAISNKWDDQTSFTVSGNYQHRQRHDDLYYIFAGDQYLEGISSQPQAASLYPRPELSLEKQGINAFFSHRANDHVEFNVSGGIHTAESQKSFESSTTALGFNSIRSRYINVAGQVYGVGAKLSYTRTHDKFSYEDTTAIALEFNGDIIDVVLDYPWQVTDKLQLRPAFNYQSATYDDTPYLATATYGGLFNRSVTVSGFAGSLRGEYQLTDAWRVVGSARADKFTRPDDVYLSYQFATTYTLADRYLLRAAYAKSNSSAFAINTATELNVEVNLGLRGSGTGPIYRRSYLGNPSLELASLSMAELGVRAKVTDRLQLDADFFRQHLKDINIFVTSELTYQPTGLPEPAPSVVPATNVLGIENIPLQAIQYGITLSANYVPTSHLQIKPFITWQQTTLENLPLRYNALPISEDNPYNIYNGVDKEHAGTPSVYGGVFVHGRISPKVEVNLSAYYYGAHQQSTAADERATQEAVASNIDSKLLLNTKVSYQLLKSLKLYGNVRNLLGNDSREYYGTDRIGRSFFGGVSYNF